MNDYLLQVSAAGRTAVRRRDWATVGACALEIRRHDDDSPEGYFLAGLVEKAFERYDRAAEFLSKTVDLDPNRYDAAIELAHLYSTKRRNGDAAALVQEFEDKLTNSPLYLNVAGSVYLQVGMPERAWRLFMKANELQPDVDMFLENIASTGVFLGKIEESKEIYKGLLERNPTHQRNHLSFARMDKAIDRNHIEQMKGVLATNNLTPDKNVFMYYAIGKELEDLEAWDEAFEHFKMAGDAIAGVADYDVGMDIALIDKIIETFDADWLSDAPVSSAAGIHQKEPIFIVGLPRTGTTLTDRILASHSKVQSVGETQFMQMTVRRESGVESEDKMTPEMIDATAKMDVGVIGQGYMDMLSYRLGDEPMFVDKLPFNILYLGYIAKAFPQARIVYVRRNPMDSCFAMYKQVFTWAYKFSYTLEGLGQFYVAFDRLLNHWRDVLGERLIEVPYESLVADQENQTRQLLEKVGLEFEDACLTPDKNESASVTASSVQVREKVHTRSVNRWKNYAEQLQPLSDYLERVGIPLD
jgi:tetratricopeptide (TPR) repeat protein